MEVSLELELERVEPARRSELRRLKQSANARSSERTERTERVEHIAKARLRGELELLLELYASDIFKIKRLLPDADAIAEVDAVSSKEKVFDASSTRV